MKILKKVLVIALSISMLSIFSRCGNSGNAGSSSEGDEKVLKVGMECAYAPFNWTQTDDSNGAVKIAGSQEYAYGYDVMMAKKIAEKLGYKLEINKMEWGGLEFGKNIHLHWH